MSLHPAIKNDLDKNLLPKGFEPTVEEMRKADGIMPVEERSKIKIIINTVVKVEDYEIPVRIYDNKENIGLSPVIVFFHGGGFVRCSLETHDEMCRRLAIYTGWKVIAPEYRLAPEYKFPIPLNDCCAVLEWVEKNYLELGIRSDRIAVLGDTAGGNLAGATTKKFRDGKKLKIFKQVLIYPVVDFYSEDEISKYKSYEKYNYGYGLSSKSMHRYWDFYLDNKSEKDNLEVSLSNDKNLSDLPSAFIISSEYDPLSDEAENYANLLSKSNINVKYEKYMGLNHAFLHAVPNINECEKLYQDISIFLNE